MTPENVNEATSVQTTQAQPGSGAASGYDAWFDEVKRIAWLMNFSDPAIATIDKDAWKEYYDAEYTPAEAWREDISCA